MSVPLANLLSLNASQVFNHRYLPYFRPEKPGWITSGLAKIASFMNKVERRYAELLRARFFLAISRTAKIHMKGDLPLGLLHFFLVLPIEVGAGCGRDGLDKGIIQMARDWVANDQIPPVRRFNAVCRCLSLKKTAYRDVLELRSQIWRLLLEVVKENVEAAKHLIDEHWESDYSRGVFSTLNFHGEPETAYQLAVQLRPHHRDFSEDMLRHAIFYTRLANLKPGKDASLDLSSEQLLRPLNRLLAEWTLDEPGASQESMLRSMDHLFRYGDPQERYWHEIPERCLELFKTLAPTNQLKRLRLLVAVAFYGDASQPCVVEALQIFDTFASGALSESSDTSHQLEVVRKMDEALSILEDKVLSQKNWYVKAHPEHLVMQLFDRHLDELHEVLISAAPSLALQNLVKLLLSLHSERLIRKHHQAFFEAFSQRVQIDPVDAGLALKRLIQYVGYSQSDDQMYRKHLCRETFDRLLPMLEAVSASDAAVARSGVGWSPRGDI